MIDKVFLYWNTIRNLKLTQVKGQIKRRMKKEQRLKYDGFMHRVRGFQIAVSKLDEDEEYLTRFDVEALMQNEILFLHEKHKLNTWWNEPTASRLWNYNLHYLEFLIPLAVKYKITKDQRYKNKWLEIVYFWMKEGGNSKYALEPYTISLRIPNILIGLELLEIEDRKIYASLYEQYKYLQKNLEKALLANHLFENLKAIVIASIIFGELDVYHKFFDLFLKQIEEQILPDGIHFERSLMYHKIILEDILRVYMVLQSSNHILDAKKLVPTIRIMAEGLTLEKSFGRIPLFNDAGSNVGKSSSVLLKVCEEIAGHINVDRNRFPDSGYYRLVGGSYILLFDCGDIGPKYMGGHAHNDCLSFEMAINGKILFTNSGTGQYQGELRTFFRSTAAHNTLMIDDREQSELWGEHRVARRLRNVKGMIFEDKELLIGQFENYQGDVFRRKLQWKENKLLIIDDIKCSDNDYHIARQFFHLVPGYFFERKKDSIGIVNGNEKVANIYFSKKSDYIIHTKGEITTYAKDFGKYENAQVLEIRTSFRDKAQLYIEIKVMEGSKRIDMK